MFSPSVVCQFHLNFSLGISFGINKNGCIAFNGLLDLQIQSPQIDRCKDGGHHLNFTVLLRE